MKKIISFALIGIVFAVVVVNIAFLKNTTRADASTYTCQANGTFATAPSGPAALTSAEQTGVASANTWLASMMQPDVAIVTNSTITPDQDYASSYTGATAGSFAISGRTYATTPTASIVVTSPATVPDSYRGVISGHVTMTPATNRWIIQAYKDNAGVVTQVPVQALADGTTGDFSIDLSGVDNSYTGQWQLGVLDANASYAPYGTNWPSPDQYVNLQVQELVVTDTMYLWATTPATNDGRFAFPNDQIGSKMFRLVDTSTSEVLAQSFDSTGLIRSYEYQLGETGYGTGIQDLTYVYDQATALYAALSQNEASTAKQLVDGLLLMQTTTGAHAGGFVFAAPQLSPTYTDPYYRTGADAIALDALLQYIKTYPTDSNIATYKAAALQGLAFLQTTYSSTGPTAGLYLGGFGNYSGSPQVFDSTYVVTFASTEHNLDVWHALTDAAEVFGSSPTNYTTLAANLDSAMTTSLYNSSLGRFNQGINGGTPDTGDPLDVNSWGAIQLYATGKTTQAQLALTHLMAFSNTVSGVTGYGPFYDSADYPGAVANVWFEGSFGAALADYYAGNYDAYRTLLNQLEPAQQTDGSFRYAQAVDSTYGIGVSKSVASTAWFILATVGRGTIWNSCIYTPPTTQPVTTSPPASNTSTNSNKSSTDTSPAITPSDLTNTTPVSGNDTLANTSPAKTASTGKVTTKTSTTKSFNWQPWIVGGSIGVGVLIIIIVIAVVIRV
jgi:hypothetical protein